MAFDGTEGGLIPLEDAARMTAKFRANFPNQIKGRFFGKEIINEILSQQGAKGLKIYFAQNDQDELEAVICAADAEEGDMLEKVGDVSEPCPPRCKKSVLNS